MRRSCPGIIVCHHRKPRRETSMRRLILVLSLCSISSFGASAQQRTMNAGAGGLLRQWPKSGPWEVVLTRTTEADLACVMLTGHKDVKTDELYLWGLRSRNGSKAVVVADRNAQAVAGDTITVSVDSVPTATYSVTKRRGENGMNAVASELDDPEFERMAGLLRLGGRVAFSTPMATYSETLHGASQALGFFNQCVVEVERLGGSQLNR